MAASAQPRLTPEEYLEKERAAEFRSEFYNGEMYAMSGGSFRHGLIIGHLVREIGNALRGRPCKLIPNDLRVRVTPLGLYAYPDVVVVCGEPRFSDSQKDTLLNPSTIIEVLSPSTEANDRGFKGAQYRSIESLQEYVIVSQREPRIEVFRRQSNGTWLLSEAVGVDASCRFESIGCTLALADVFENIEFDAEPPEDPDPRVRAERALLNLK